MRPYAILSERERLLQLGGDDVHHGVVGGLAQRRLSITITLSASAHLARVGIALGGVANDAKGGLWALCCVC
jgi:hypothetical protein